MKTCEYCRKQFIPKSWPSFPLKQRYCSALCRLEAHRRRWKKKPIRRLCEICKTPFNTRPHGETKRVCSRRCGTRKRYCNHREDLLRKASVYYFSHPLEFRRRNKKYRTRLGDGYVRKLLCAGTSLTAKDFSPEIVEVQRNKVRLLRLIK